MNENTWIKYTLLIHITLKNQPEGKKTAYDVLFKLT